MIEVSVETLRAWRRRKHGPPYYREGNPDRGRIYYFPEDIQAWRQASRWG
jgi:hypothetical protein